MVRPPYAVEWMAAGDRNEEFPSTFEMWFRGRLCRIEVEIAGPDRTIGAFSPYVECASISPVECGPRLVVAVDEPNLTLEETVSDAEWREIDRAFWDEHPEYARWWPVYRNADGLHERRIEEGEDYEE